MDDAERMRRLGIALTSLERGQHAEAAQVCRQLVADDCDDIEAQLLLGLAIGMRGDAVAAAPILNRVAQVRRGYAHPCSDLARLLTSHGNAAFIAPQFRACLDLTPGDLRLTYAFAECLRSGGAAEQAVALLDPVLTAHPAYAETHYQMGMALAELVVNVALARVLSLFLNAVWSDRHKDVTVAGDYA